ncbi:MAG: radical SAM protein [Candidatus Azambacteria bacterium]|nr:radical SAM protein [Candidatus Azambacteria bacterium]
MTKSKNAKKISAEQPKRIYGKRTDFTENVLSKELGEKYIDYRKKWAKASERKLNTDFPLYIQIEHTGRCNLMCKNCIQGIKNLREDYSKSFKPLDINLYKKVLEEARKYGCPSMAFHNNDEPLLLQDLEERIRLAKRAGFIDLIITTNATLLTKNRADKLLGSGLTKINFSVDAANAKDYEKIRIGGNFKKVLENIDYFMKERQRRKLKLPITRATSVLTCFTYDKMEEFKKFWEKRVDVVEFQNFQAIRGYTEKSKPDNSEIDRNFICNAPWQQLVIRANGDVLPCCSFYGTGLVIGNIQNSSLHNIWHNLKMKKIRAELLKNNFNFSLACKNCSETFYVVK